MRRLFLLFCLLATLPGFSTAVVEERPFDAPAEMQAFVRRATLQFPTNSTKAQGLLRACFLPESDGGLGITYDNDYTRTVAEVWRDRKANCLALTAFFYAGCKAVGVETSFAESPSISQWRRVGSLIRHELHVVAIVRQLPLTDLVADFLPEMRKGFYLVRPITELRARALFYSNRAVELVETGQAGDALALVGKAIAQDPSCGAAWNVQGVIQRALNDDAAAEQSFLRALAVNRKDGAAMGNLETLYRSNGQFEQALIYRRMAMMVRAEDPYFQAFLAEEATTSGDLDQAVKHLERAIKLQRQEPEFYLQLSRIHQLRGRSKDAVEVLSKGQKLMDPVEQEKFQGKLAKLRASA
jgi:Tfp pilus assembly protein PilF